MTVNCLMDKEFPRLTKWSCKFMWSSCEAHVIFMWWSCEQDAQCSWKLTILAPVWSVSRSQKHLPNPRSEGAPTGDESETPKWLGCGSLERRKGSAWLQTACQLMSLCTVWLLQTCLCGMVRKGRRVGEGGKKEEREREEGRGSRERKKEEGETQNVLIVGLTGCYEYTY